MIIQIILLLGLALAALLVAHERSSATHQALRRILALTTVVAGAGAVIFPEALNEVASWVGVGRGADLVLYLAVVGFLLTTIGLYRRCSELDRKLTILAREIALSAPERTPEERP